ARPRCSFQNKELPEVSPILSSIVTAAGGLLAGLALAGALLWRQQQALNLARYAAEHDDTTGLPNRRALLAALTRSLRRSAPWRAVRPYLGRVNATTSPCAPGAGTGGPPGVGRRPAALAAPVRLAARLSGAEFALLVDGGPEQAATAATAAWRAVSRQPIPL